MANGIDVSRLVATYSDPDPHDPYTFGGVSRAPKIYDRVFNTPDDVRRHIAQAKVTRRMNDADISARSGVSSDAIQRLCEKGEGSLRDFVAVTEALGIRAVRIPTSIILEA
jgi:DNA-binding phage protein